MHPLLLHGQSLTIERPDRTIGTAVGAAITGLALVIAIALLLRALDWPASFPQFLAYAGAVTMTVVAAAFAFWTYACATMQYIVDPEGLTVRWGPISHRVPAGEIGSILRGKGGEPPSISGVGWLGHHAGRGRLGDHDRIVFFSTHRVPEDIVYLTTPGVTYAVSPKDPGRFMAAVERARRAVAAAVPAGVGAGSPAAEPASEATSEPFVERGLLAAHPIWSDRIAQGLLAVAVLLNAALWGYILAVYPDLSNEITIEFPPLGDITTLESREEIFNIPLTATAVLAVNLLAALVFQARERAATYLLLSGTIFFQLVFWVAAIVAVVNA